jgi:rhodanese-related sulfurtransferase
MQTSSTESTQTAAAKKPAQQSSLSGVVDLDPKEFERKHQELGGTLLDVRTPAEIAQFRIDGASTVDINDPQFRSKIDKLAKDQPVFVYCHSGGRSARAAKMLKEAGVTQVYNLDGGISAWKRAQLATVSSPLAQPEEPAKETTLAEFDAKLQNSPVVLAEFQTQWCAPCVGMRPVVEQLRNKHGDDKVVVVDVDASEALATREKASGVPVFVLYQKGRETFRHSGALSFEELDAKLNQAP